MVLWLCSPAHPAVAQTPSPAAPSTSPSGKTCRRASPSTRRPRSRRCGPSMPCFNNLVLFDPLKTVESADTIIGELAEKWSWQDNYRSLVFFLRKDVKWHDGKPFTSKDVKYTFDMVREAPDAAAKLRINPRKDWYAQRRGGRGAGRRTPSIFRLKRPAAVPPDDARLRLHARSTPPTCRRPAIGPAASGTGPFKVKEWRKGEFVEYVKNPDYFVKGRPVSRRAPVHGHQGAGHADRGAPGRPGRRVVPGRGVQGQRRAAQAGGAPGWS